MIQCVTRETCLQEMQTGGYLYVLCGGFLLATILPKVEPTLYQYSVKEQQSLLLQAAKACWSKIIIEQNSTNGVTGCPADFDDIVCWPAAEANSTITAPCPKYIHLFDTEESASRYCTAAGDWSVSPQTNLSRGSYTRCVAKSQEARRLSDEFYDTDPGSAINPLILKHIRNIEIIYTVGNTLSIIALVIALLLFACFRKLLGCRRNVIHVNLFLSFLLRAVFTVVHFSVTAKQDSNLEQDYKLDQNFSVYISNKNANWECKLLSTLWMYTRLTNFAWIFLEALYLHLLIFVLTFNERLYGLRIVVSGWCLPLVFLIPWVVVRALTDDYKCWVTYQHPNLRYIVEAPVIVIVLVNFGFFINFIKLLATKLRASQANGYKQKISRRLTKSTAVLIPLFGVHYIVFLFMDFHGHPSETGVMEVIYLYFNTIFTSLQGLAVAVLFCFCNGEVRTEIERRWLRFKQHTQLSDLSQQNQFRRTQLKPRISLSSDTGMTFASRRASSGTGAISLGLIPKSPSASFCREASVASPITPITEEHHALLNEENKTDVNRNCFNFELADVHGRILVTET